MNKGTINCLTHKKDLVLSQTMKEEKIYLCISPELHQMVSNL